MKFQPKQLLTQTQRFLRWNILCFGALALAVCAVLISLLIKSDNNAGTPPAAAVNGSAITGWLAGQWAYLPGSSRIHVTDPLQILPQHFAIVNQDGSGGQPNPPVNLFGSHAQVQGDFGVTATLRGVSSKADIQFYGEVPLIADEFRIERKSVRLSFDAKTLTVSTWDGASQTPSTQTFAFTPANDHSIELAMKRQDDKLEFTVNGTTLGSVPEKAVFGSGLVWFGADAPDTSWSLSKLDMQALGKGTVSLVDNSKLSIANQGALSLQTLAGKKRPGFLVGAAMALGPAVSDSQYADVAFGGNFGQLTTENALKWQFVEPQPNQYDFQEGDALVALAQQHNLAVHGHTLVFGEANPRWVQDLPTKTDTDKQHVRDVMVDHIKTVVGHYKGKIATWDVVNEPLADYDTFDSDSGQILRTHKWEQAMGESYIATAFTAAHETDPNAQLFMNEFGLEEDGDRWDAFVALLQRLQAQHVPINGVGIQAHVYDAGDKINTTVLKKHIEILASMGLKTRISEMDVYSDDGQSVQAQQFSRVFQACLSEPGCVSWTTWGVSDRYDFFKDDDGSIQQGEDLLWDKNMQPTPAVSALQALLR